jgi:hypothetical protein
MALEGPSTIQYRLPTRSTGLSTALTLPPEHGVSVDHSDDAEGGENESGLNESQVEVEGDTIEGDRDHTLPFPLPDVTLEQVVQGIHNINIDPAPYVYLFIPLCTIFVDGVNDSSEKLNGFLLSVLILT